MCLLVSSVCCGSYICVCSRLGFGWCSICCVFVLFAFVCLNMWVLVCSIVFLLCPCGGVYGMAPHRSACHALVPILPIVNI